MNAKIKVRSNWVTKKTQEKTATIQKKKKQTQHQNPRTKAFLLS